MQEFFHQNTDFEVMWLGAIDGFYKDNFTLWSNGKDLNYTNWQVGQLEKDNKHQHCLLLNVTDGKWDAKECNSTDRLLASLCEINAPRAGIVANTFFVS